MILLHRNIAMLVCLLASLWSALAYADDMPEFQIEIRDHLFYPAEFDVPAARKVRLIIVNRDATPEEFESYELNREKVVMGGARVPIYIGPLKPGEYPFFGEFNPKTAQGKIIAIEKP